MTVPTNMLGIGYTQPRDDARLEAIRVPVPRPGPDQILIHVAASSLNPLDAKLAQLNFFGRTPPVILGFDLAGTVVEVGERVERFSIGDAVCAMADSNRDGGWAEGGAGGYAVASEWFAAPKPATVSFAAAGASPLCFTAAYLGLHGRVAPGDAIYIPGGGGGVGHLAIQLAARVLGAGLVISSAGTPETLALARRSGAHHVFDYRRDDVAARIAELTAGRGVDVVFDATYSEHSFAATAAMVRPGGTWVVLGVGPGRTSRTEVTASPVDAILAERGAHHVNANMLRYFQEPARLDAAARQFWAGAMSDAMRWADSGRVVPHIGNTIPSTVDAINDGLTAMRAGRGPAGKTAVIVDRAAAAP